MPYKAALYGLNPGLVASQFPILKTKRFQNQRQKLYEFSKASASIIRIHQGLSDNLKSEAKAALVFFEQQLEITQIQFQQRDKTIYSEGFMNYILMHISQQMAPVVLNISRIFQTFPIQQDWIVAILASDCESCVFKAISEHVGRRLKLLGQDKQLQALVFNSCRFLAGNMFFGRPCLLGQVPLEQVTEQFEGLQRGQKPELVYENAQMDRMREVQIKNWFADRLNGHRKKLRARSNKK